MFGYYKKMKGYIFIFLFLILANPQVFSDQMEELKAAREKVRTGVDPALLRAYDRLAKVYKRRVVVPVVNGTCSGCFGVLATARLQKARSGDRTLFCEHCGRILFWL